jgi:hypothetical protein
MQPFLSYDDSAPEFLNLLSMQTIATVCMFLAGKVEETPRPLKDVIMVSYELIHKKDPAAGQKIKQRVMYPIEEFSFAM